MDEEVIFSIACAKSQSQLFVELGSYHTVLLMEQQPSIDCPKRLRSTLIDTVSPNKFLLSVSRRNKSWGFTLYSLYYVIYRQLEWLWHIYCHFNDKQFAVTLIKQMLHLGKRYRLQVKKKKKKSWVGEIRRRTCSSQRLLTYNSTQAIWGAKSWGCSFWAAPLSSSSSTQTCN